MDQIRQLRDEGLSLSLIAERTGVTPAVVLRIAGKVDQEARRQKQEQVAREIHAHAVPWHDQVARWKERTGQSEATFWRVLQRCD